LWPFFDLSPAFNFTVANEMILHSLALIDMAWPERSGTMPTPPFVASLDAEIARLEGVVENIPEVRQLNELRRVRALYAEPNVILQGTEDDFAEVVAPARPGRKMAPERQQAIDFVAKLLEKELHPIRTITLLEALRGNEIIIGGSDPVNSLSALLSTSGQFMAHGRSGWTLKRDAPGLVPVTRTEIEEEEQSSHSTPADAGNGNPGARAPGVLKARLP
jgi:hypothetical protein